MAKHHTTRRDGTRHTETHWAKRVRARRRANKAARLARRNNR